MAKIHRGWAGEAYICRFLLEKDFKILERNYKTKTGEVDIIARRQKSLFVFEVKTWKRCFHEDLDLVITRRKKNRMEAVFLDWIAKNSEHSTLEEVHFYLCYLNPVSKKLSFHLISG